jgi:hypothetical protein
VDPTVRRLSVAGWCGQADPSTALARVGMQFTQIPTRLQGITTPGSTCPTGASHRFRPAPLIIVEIHCELRPCALPFPPAQALTMPPPRRSLNLADNKIASLSVAGGGVVEFPPSLT